jgi:capsular polysaccharide biosynthesis protein
MYVTSLGRNEPCPCGSGRRYKHCHGAVGSAENSVASRSLQLFASKTLTRKVIVFPPRRSRQPLAPIYHDSPDDPAYRHHFGFEDNPSGHVGLGCYISSEYTVCGSGLLIRQDNSVVTNEDLMPNYWHKRLPQQARYIDFQSRLPTRLVEEPCISILGWGHDQYGHVITEALPRLMLALRLAKEHDVFPKLLLLHGTPPWLLAILKNHTSLRESSFIFFDPYAERVQLKRGMYPCYPYQHGGYQPDVVDLLGDLREIPPIAERRNGRYFISRIRLQDTLSRRVCMNEAELADVAQREFGFQVATPEEIPWAEQLAIFRTAKAVVGLYGSALHTAILAGSGLHVGTIGDLNGIQTPIGALQRQRMSYQVRDIQLNGQYSISLESFRRHLEAITESIVDK